MTENKLIIIVEKPVEYVFDFTTNPKNTPKWIDSIDQETTDTKEIRLGTVYSKQTK